MPTNIIKKNASMEDVAKEWQASAWNDIPSNIATIPFDRHVLLGIVSQDGTQRVSFFVTAEDAEIIGHRLIQNARLAK